MTKKDELTQIGVEIRELIDNKQKELNLSFVEDTHTYHIKTLDGIMTTKFPSVSTVIKQFYEDFPALEKSLDMSDNNIEAQDTLLKEWRATADYANSKGSRVHYLLETDLLKQYGSYKTVRKPFFECDETQVSDGNAMVDAGHNFITLMHRRGAILLDTEMILGSNELKYTGQPDKVWLLFNEKDELGFIVTDWKGLPLDTPILTGNGWKTMGTLSKSDQVYDKDGNLVNIINISKVKNKKCLKIKFDNNEEIISDYEHRWLLYTKNSDVKKEMVMTTQEIKDYNDSLIKRQSYNILKIDNPKPLNNPEIELPIDPYILGVWLGDGHSIDAKITQANENVWEEVVKRGYEIGNDLSQGGSGKATTRTVFSLQTKLRINSLLQNKHIPEIYLSSSFEQRLDLLRGLMDSDGTYNKTRKRFVMESTRQQQVDYFTEIASSLGVKVSNSSFNKKFNGGIIKCYRASFVTDDFNPFLSRNQDLEIDLKKDRRTFRSIISVEEVESVPTKCIEVDSPSSTFLCGKTLLVTHNTNKIKNFEVQHYTTPMLPPFENEMDTALTHYKVQLPLYARLILDMLKGTKYENIKLFGCIIVHLTSVGTFEEYRVPSYFINKVMTMDPLPRIDEVLRKKETDIIAEETRVEKLKTWDREAYDNLKWFEKG
tara:strand:- start:6105 stop:8075 length:1971 start_codon:yes stop_codon:yes gene_type:complete